MITFGDSRITTILADLCEQINAACYAERHLGAERPEKILVKMRITYVRDTDGYVPAMVTATTAAPKTSTESATKSETGSGTTSQVQNGTTTGRDVTVGTQVNSGSTTSADTGNSTQNQNGTNSGNEVGVSDNQQGGGSTQTTENTHGEPF